MKTYGFDMKVEGHQIKSGDDFDMISDHLFEAGCENSGYYTEGSDLYIGFDREAESLEEAIDLARREVESIPNLKVVEAKEY